ncbi:MAG: DNA cytosine methyltransferase [Ignavibacteria bacterium]|nr:DNA cytosine methyltransferase [Ignavibacteria bacterium]
MDRIVTKEHISDFFHQGVNELFVSNVYKKLNVSNGEIKKFKFIDLFAGIGGIRLPFEKLKGECVFTSEWDTSSQKTYFANFGEIPYGDINSIDVSEIPDHDILLAGFPCQAFSVAGYRKGFEDTRGTLFFNIAKILDRNNPPRAFLLENVKGLENHDNGNTLSRMIEILETLNYKVENKVLNSMTHANIPQNRERIFIIGIHKDYLKEPFSFPEKTKLNKTIHDFIDYRKQDEKYYYNNHKYYALLKKKIISRDTIYQWRRGYVRENKNNVCPTLTANMGTGGHNVPIILDDYGIRKLTPRECANFQGYDTKKFILPPLSDTKLYSQIGNSVTVPLVKRIADKLIEYLEF